MLDYSYRDPAVATFLVIPLLLAGALAWGVRAAWQTSGASGAAAARASGITGVLAAAWLATTWAVADTGVLRRWDLVPPPLFLLLVSIASIALVIAFGVVGRRLAGVPLWVLVAVQAFRLPLEIAMHGMYERGIMPIELTYTGRNFDIVTGATAIVVAALVARGYAGRRLVMLWNVVGLALLVNVVTVAVLATPIFLYFGDERPNVWVTYPPFVWLPAVMVLAALAGHLLIFNALRLQRGTAT